jgi:predicted molibdopterin-dependent oxidoreductase YjgC
VLIALGHDVLDPAFGAEEEIFRRLDTLILLDSHHSALERVAHVVLPARVAAEKLGTLTNHAGRVQRVEPAVEPAHLAYAEGETLVRLARALGLSLFGGRASEARSEPQASGVPLWDPRTVSRAIGAAVPAFAGIDVDSVGTGGLPLRDARA